MVRGRGWLGVKLSRMLGMEGASLNVIPTGLQHYLNGSDADVIHLHWIHNEMISIREIAQIKKPLVWTLHDMWPLCATDHFTEHMIPPFSPALKGLSRAVSAYIYRLKKRLWNNLCVHLVAPSKWIAERAQQSDWFPRTPCSVITNGLDLDTFRPKDKEQCRRQLGLPQERKLILFGAHNPQDRRKGGDLLVQALYEMKRKIRENVNVVIVGRACGLAMAGLPTHWMGSMATESGMATLYNAADTFVCPSRADNLPNMIAEAIACGLPCVGFRVGGIPEMVDHKRTGWLAEPYRVEDLGAGMEWALGLTSRLEKKNNRSTSAECIEADPDRKKMMAACREKAESLFCARQAAQKHLGVYEQSIRATRQADACIR
jgi:glycosyltransferase involved in cell wall biosynthesis